MNRKYRYFPDESRGLFICRMLMNILIFVTLPVACGIYMSKPPVAVLFSALEMLTAVILMEVIQRCLKGFGIYTLAHLTVLLLIYIGAPYFAYMHLCLAGAATLVMYSDRAMQRRDFYPTPVWLIYPLTIYTVGYVGENAMLKGLGVFTEIMMIALFFFYQNQRGMERTFNTAKNYVRVPYRKMRMVNALMFGAFAAASILLALILSQIFNGEAIVRMIGKGILTGYALLTLGFFWLFSHLIPNGGGDAMSGMESVAIADLLAKYHEEHPYLSMLWKGLEILMFLIAAVCAVHLLYHLWLDFYRDFRSADLETDDVKVRIVNEEDKSHGRINRVPGKSPGFLSPSARMRRLYVRYIRRHPKLDRIRPSHTPAEIEQAVEAAGNGDVRELYERARYAPGLAEEKDLREMRRKIG